MGVSVDGCLGVGGRLRSCGGGGGEASIAPLSRAGGSPPTTRTWSTRWPRTLFVPVIGGDSLSSWSLPGVSPAARARADDVHRRRQEITTLRSWRKTTLETAPIAAADSSSLWSVWAITSLMSSAAAAVSCFNFSKPPSGMHLVTSGRPCWDGIKA